MYVVSAVNIAVSLIVLTVAWMLLLYIPARRRLSAIVAVSAIMSCVHGLLGTGIAAFAFPTGTDELPLEIAPSFVLGTMWASVLILGLKLSERLPASTQAA